LRLGLLSRKIGSRPHFPRVFAEGNA